MDDKRIKLLEESWLAIDKQQLSIAFYSELFRGYPSLKGLFRNTDMVAQKRKLVGAIGYVVSSLRSLDSAIPVLREMGRRHAGYGVKPAHYDVVGGVLISVLRVLSPQWDAEHEAAWTEAYTLVAGAMQSCDPGPLSAVL